jgi:hypothetical protein
VKATKRLTTGDVATISSHVAELKHQHVVLIMSCSMHPTSCHEVMASHINSHSRCLVARTQSSCDQLSDWQKQTISQRCLELSIVKLELWHSWHHSQPAAPIRISQACVPRTIVNQWADQQTLEIFQTSISQVLESTLAHLFLLPKMHQCRETSPDPKHEIFQKSQQSPQLFTAPFSKTPLLPSKASNLKFSFIAVL